MKQVVCFILFFNQREVKKYNWNKIRMKKIHRKEKKVPNHKAGSYSHFRKADSYLTRAECEIWHSDFFLFLLAFVFPHGEGQ